VVQAGSGARGGYRGNTEHLIVARRGIADRNPTCADCGGRARGARKCGCTGPRWTIAGRPSEPPRRPFLSTGEGTWFESPRLDHSEKPPLFADLIERMSPGPYVELFARAPRLGWDAWGKGYE
jgi:N6-adenosine-specific RNA methylase IME4